MKRNIFIIVLGALLITSCSDNYLNRPPAGSTLLEEQYGSLSNRMEGSMRGIYAMMYEVSDHDEFGQRSIDMYTDILSGDMALTAKTYGWFYTDEQMNTAIGRTGYLWAYYYGILHNTNAVINTINTQSDILKVVAEQGFPSMTDYKFSDAQKEAAYYYAEALTMRGYVYANMARFYVPIPSVVLEYGFTFESYPTIPLYNESNMNTPRARSFAAELYQQVERDLTTAIEYFSEFGDDFVRTSKLEVDINVARGLLAYAKLNEAYYYSDEDKRKQAFDDAEKYASDVIASGEYSILPNSDLYSTGFNDVQNKSWMWGQDVVTETAGGLASFFGQVDIHSYSYAWAGDTKVIDKLLYDTIPSWDGRKKWFNDGSVSKKFLLCPDGKFYSAQCPTSTKDEDIDREWLSDNVFMRVESMYLIAAEAAYQNADYGKSATYLNQLTDERLDLASETASAEYSTYKSKLGDPAYLFEQIYYNWRVELWGEGYGLQTFRRLAPDKKRRGGNHDYGAGQQMDPADSKFLFSMPSSESTYNTNI